MFSIPNPLSSLGNAISGVGHETAHLASSIIPFDPTPGFNLTLGSSGLAPGIAASGTSNPIGKTTGASTARQPTSAASPASASYGGGGSYAGGGSASSYDPSAAAYLDSLQGNAQNQINQLGSQQAIGSQNILDAYNNAFNQLSGQKAVADRNYQTSKDQTLQDYTSAKGNVQAGVGQQSNALQRLLGQHGYTGSANLAANYAAAKQGAQQNQQLGGTFGRNQQALDTNYGDYTNQYTSSVNDLGHQRDVQNNQLQAQINQNKSALLSQLAQIAQQRAQYNGGGLAQIQAAAAPYQAQINQLGAATTQLGREYANPVLQATPATYKAPSLDSYNVQPQQAAQLSSAPGANDTLSPFLSVLLGGNQQKQALNNVF